MERLFGFGQTLASDLPIVGAIPLAINNMVDWVPDVSITLKQTHICKQDAVYHIDNGALLFAPQRVGLYRCRPHGIEVTPCPDCDVAELLALLIATALPAVQWLQRSFVAHASAVVLPGKFGAIAITGSSGSGKSTLASQLLARGANLLADDSLRITRGRSSWMAAGLPGGLHIHRGDAADRYFDAIEPARAVLEARLDAIFVLGQRKAVPSIRRLDGLNAIAQVVEMQHRPLIPAVLGLRESVLKLMTEISSSVPIFLWERSVGGTALEEGEWNMLRTCCGDEVRSNE